MTRRAARGVAVAAALAALAAGSAFGHINSPHVFLEEPVGPYPAIMIVHMPAAVPGEAEFQIRLQDAAAGEAIAVEIREIPPEGEQFAPPWIAAVPSEVDPGFFTAPVPLMSFGLWNIDVRVAGSRGEGETRIPIAARTPPPKELPPWLGVVLGLLVLFFFVFFWQIMTGLGRDGRLRRGETPAVPDVRRGRRFAVVGCSFFAVFFTFIGYHWSIENIKFEKKGTPPLESTLEAASGSPDALVAGRRHDLSLLIRNRRGQLLENVLASRGKDMHAVVVSLPGFTSFHHLHPKLTSPGTFTFSFRPPAPGEYRVFADVMSPTGLGETVTHTVTAIGGGGAGAEPEVPDDPDDSFAFQPAFDRSRAGHATADAGGGYTMAWVDGPPGPLETGEFLKLAFELRGPGGSPVEALEPYIGLAGHLMVLREDAGVFAHLHPTGSLGGRMSSPAADPSRIETSRISFPYGFPEPGAYRLFVQMKHGGAVRTAAFDAVVE